MLDGHHKLTAYARAGVPALAVLLVGVAAATIMWSVDPSRTLQQVAILASLRDRSKVRWAQVFYGLLSLGWRGSAIHWARWQRVYRLIAILAVPLVVSVHSGVALLYAVGQLPGWHSTIFPPFFVIGAIFSGFAIVAMIAIVLLLLAAACASVGGGGVGGGEARGRAGAWSLGSG